MSIKVALQNPQTGEIKLVKVGWSWILFLFSGVYGIPLFKRKLFLWGFVFLAINLFGTVCNIASDNPISQLGLIVLLLLSLVLIIFLGAKGNEMTAKNYLARGWRFLEPNSEMTKFAKMKWHIFDQPAGISTLPGQTA